MFLNKKSVFLSIGLMLLAAVAEAGHGYYGGLGSGGRSVSFLLVALAAGYWVLTLADKQKKPLDTLGRILGGLILLISVAGLICSAVFGYCRYSKCGVGKGKISNSGCVGHYKGKTEVPSPQPGQ